MVAPENTTYFRTLTWAFHVICSVGEPSCVDTGSGSMPIGKLEWTARTSSSIEDVVMILSFFGEAGSFSDISWATSLGTPSTTEMAFSCTTALALDFASAPRKAQEASI